VLSVECLLTSVSFASSVVTVVDLVRYEIRVTLGKFKQVSQDSLGGHRRFRWRDGWEHAFVFDDLLKPAAHDAGVGNKKCNDGS
jgi:hypothetical protein